MLELGLEVLKFILFLISIVLGFLTALLILPFPGKTFFNKMYKLPNKVKIFIDDVIALFNSLLRIAVAMTNVLNRAIAGRSSKRTNEVVEL
jgi:hypothetical protein